MRSNPAPKASIKNNFLGSIILLISCFAIYTVAIAQPDPLGFAANEAAGTGFSYNHNVHSSYVSGREGQVGSTAKEVYMSGLGGVFHVLLTIPATSDLNITSVKEKIDFNQPDVLGVLVGLSDGSSKWIVHHISTSANAVYTHPPLPGIQTGAGVQFAGDAVYGISGVYLYVSVDSGQTWTLDTTGFHSATLNSVDIDSSQNAWVAASNGVYKQALGGNTWTLSTCPIPNAKYVYVDHYNDRVYVCGSYAVYYSADEGSTWHTDTSGLQNMNVIALGGNSQGDIYAIVSTTFGIGTGDQVFRSPGGIGAFTRIDQPLSALNGQQANTSIYTFVTGDSISITAGSKMGFFTSTDNGASWHQSPGIVTDQCFGLAVANNGVIVANNRLGAFARAPGDTAWIKVNPLNTFGQSGLVYRDDPGNLYTQTIDMGGYTGPWMVSKSTDNGLSWAPDSVGAAGTTMYSWWVDEAGNQYAGGAGTPCVNSVKAPAGSWHVDTAGMVTGAYDYGTAFGSDHNGNIYQALYSGNIFTRPATGGPWTITTGLGNDAVYSFAHLSNHTMIAGGTGNVHINTGNGNWQNMNIGAPAPQGTTPFEVAVDDSDYVWVAFSHQDGGGNYVGDGVFYTHDLGNTWYAAQGQVTVATFRALIASGDSVFGLSYFDGVYVFKRGAGSAGIPKLCCEPQYLSAYPNPFNNQTNIQYTLPERSVISLKIYDMLGNTVSNIDNQTETEGLHNTTWAPQSMAAGIYLCKLTVAGVSGEVYTQTIKLNLAGRK